MIPIQIKQAGRNLLVSRSRRKACKIVQIESNLRINILIKYLSTFRDKITKTWNLFG